MDTHWSFTPLLLTRSYLSCISISPHPALSCPTRRLVPQRRVLVCCKSSRRQPSEGVRLPVFRCRRGDAHPAGDRVEPSARRHLQQCWQVHALAALAVTQLPILRQCHLRADPLATETAAIPCSSPTSIGGVYHQSQQSALNHTLSYGRESSSMPRSVWGGSRTAASCPHPAAANVIRRFCCSMQHADAAILPSTHLAVVVVAKAEHDAKF